MKRTKQSQKKTKFLFVLLILTAILSITATYAWFSSQRDVEITSMRLNVEVAESMQISLDGETWTQSITIGNMKQFYGTYVKDAGDTFALYQANKDDNDNYVPKELVPVSTIGEVSNGQIQFVTGEVKDIGGTSVIESLTACTETDIFAADATIATKETAQANHPYLVFDMYLKNTSAQTNDPLYLNLGSRVWVSASTIATTNDGVAQSPEGIGTEGTGLEYSARVGFVTYKNTADMTATGATVRALTADKDTDNKATAAIWEPNHLQHIQEVVTNNVRVESTSEFVTTYGIKAAASTHVFDEDTKNYAVADINGTTGTYLSEQKVFKSPDDKYTVRGGITELLAITDTNGAAVALEPNKITKVRVYVWLEGQDPDCINTASLGDRLLLDLKLTKKPGTDSGGVSYQ